MKQKTTVSSSARYLFGKKIPGLPAPIQSVMKQGPTRTIVDVRGNTMTVTKERLKTMMMHTMAQHQQAEMLKTVRPTIDGRATVQMGGNIKGQQKTFNSMQEARDAVRKRYLVGVFADAKKRQNKSQGKSR